MLTEVSVARGDDKAHPHLMGSVAAESVWFPYRHTTVDWKPGELDQEPYRHASFHVVWELPILCYLKAQQHRLQQCGVPCRMVAGRNWNSDTDLGVARKRPG